MFYQGASFGAPSPLKRGDQLKAQLARQRGNEKPLGCLKFEFENLRNAPKHILRRPRAGGDPYAVSPMFCTSVSGLVERPRCNHDRQGLWVPACAGTTNFCAATTRVKPGNDEGEGCYVTPPAPSRRALEIADITPYAISPPDLGRPADTGSCRFRR